MEGKYSRIDLKKSNDVLQELPVGIPVFYVSSAVM